jgi:hypothetical protein
VPGGTVEALLAGGYAIFLAAAATGLELIGRHAHRRSHALPTTGFTYHRNLDLWICPTGRPLHRTHSDDGGRVLRYRADARLCNECPIKHRCTNSDDGRLVEHYPDSWLQSGLRLFHRGLSVTLLVLAFLVLIVEVFRQRCATPEIALAVLAIVVGGCVVWSVVELQSHNQNQ